MFCFVRRISVRLTPGEPGWGEPLLDFLIWGIEVLGRQESTSEVRFASIRLMHLANGNVDFSSQAHRAKAMITGIKKRDGAVRKQPFNTDLSRRMHSELVCKSVARSNGTGPLNFEIFAACIMGFPYLLRISEIVSRKWRGISVDTREGRNYLSVRIKQSETDIPKDGLLRPWWQSSRRCALCKPFKN